MYRCKYLIFSVTETYVICVNGDSQFLRSSPQSERWRNFLFSYIISLSADKSIIKEGESYEKYFWRELKTITNGEELYPGAGGATTEYIAEVSFTLGVWFHDAGCDDASGNCQL